MFPEFGLFCLIIAMILLMLQGVAGLSSAHFNWPAITRLTRRISLLQCLFILASFGMLAHAFLVNDFSVAYVAANSNVKLPAIYRFCAVWGAHEGSMLLWVSILSIWIACVGLFGKQLPDQTKARILGVLGFMGVGFLWFLLSTSNPFIRLLPHIPLHGRDLNPLLQDPGLAIHPPMLYMGYVGFSVAFAFAITALIEGRFNQQWARWLRPWTLVAWCFLTFGIVLGSWWAYRELGWGGWWFWDPVENASLLPWLVGTALIHSLAVCDKRNTFKAWTVLLSLIAFSLSLLGTFLVRSGVLISVHAFAVDPLRGVFILRYLVIVVGGSLMLFAWRAPRLLTKANYSLVSRESFITLNNIILTVSMVTILLGTLYPLIINALGLGTLSVGAPYFNRVFVPLMLPMLLLMGIVPMIGWGKVNVKQLKKRFIILMLAALFCAFAIPFVLVHQLKASVVCIVGLAVWIISSTVWQEIVMSRIPKEKRPPKRRLGMLTAHIGVAVCALGIVLSSVYSQEKDVRIKPGEYANIAGYQVKLNHVDNAPGPNYIGVKADVSTFHNNRLLTHLFPEVRYFPADKTALSKSAIDMNVWRDIYVAISQPLGNDSWAMRIYFRPFVRWIWFGGLLMMLGGLIVIFTRRSSEGRDKC